jgi:cytochrome c553
VHPQDTAPASTPPPRPGVGRLGVLAAVVLGAIIGGMAVEFWFVKYGPAAPAAQQTKAGAPSADVQHLTAIAPTQSHTMFDVGYFWANMWFAAQKKNWPLAGYFFNEARQAVRWTVLIRPVRQLPGGGTVDIKGQFDAIDPSAFAFVQLAIEDQDSQAFETAYKQALTACHTCHAAAGLPFIRPTIPTAPPTTILSYDK